VVVAAMLARKERSVTPVSRGAGAFLHLVLWPLFLPMLLPEEATPPTRHSTEWDERIQRAEAMLGDALKALGVDLGDPLALELARVAALGRSMRHAAARINDIEAALALPVHDLALLRRELERAEANPDEQSVAEVFRRRLEHVEQLEAIRRTARVDLERALAEAGALASRLTLLRYEHGETGTAAHRARELTDTVDELCRVLAEARAA
jgi:hypothetical protein